MSVEIQSELEQQPFLIDQMRSVSRQSVQSLAANLAFDWPESECRAICLLDPLHLAVWIISAITYRRSIVLLPPVRDLHAIHRLLRDEWQLTLVTDIAAVNPPFSFPEIAPYEKLPNVVRSNGSVGFVSSGTTGEPKIIRVSCEHIQQAVRSFLACGGSEYRHYRTYLTAPLAHSYGCSCLLELLHGRGTCVLPSPSPFGAMGDLLRGEQRDALEAIEGTPSFFAQMSTGLNSISLPLLKHIGLGADAPRKSDIEKIRNKYPSISVSVRYGMTEMPSAVSHRIYDKTYGGDFKAQGKPIDIYEIRIDRERGESEILVKGGAAPNFIATGDSGYLDEAGEIHITGRKSAFILRNGYRFSPELIEEALLESGRVQGSRAKQVETQLIVEYVAGPTFVSEEELFAFLQGALPDYCKPDHFIAVDGIPRTPNGKIVRVVEQG